MEPKNHLKYQIKIGSEYIYIGSPYINENSLSVGYGLLEEIPKNEDNVIITPVYFSPDKKIYFHGGYFLPFTHLPMPEAANQDFINQYPKVREVEFSPLFSALISKKIVDKLGLPEYFSENIIEHARYVMEAKKLGAKILVTPRIHVIYQRAYNPSMGSENFRYLLERELISFSKEYGKELDKRYKYPIVLHTIVSYAGGYNLHGYYVAKTLTEMGIRVYYQFIGGTNVDEQESESAMVDDLKEGLASFHLPQITLVHGYNNFKNSGYYKIFFSTTEVEGIPDDWTYIFNQADEIWATSEFARQAFINSGVKKPVYNIGEGVDPNYIHPDILPFFNKPKEKFRFMSNFAWGRRKGVDVLFEAFRKEFDEDEDVCLMLKVTPSYSGHNIQDELHLLYDRPGSAPIYIYDLILPKWEIGRFYTMGNVFVWPSRGEGYGLPALEALASGLPVIASNYSAHLEFLTKNNKPLPGVELIDGKLERYPGGDSIYYHGFHWFTPSVEDLRKKMRKVYENYKDYKEKALKSSEYVRKHFNWKVSTKKIIERIKDIYKNKLKIKKY